MECFEKLLLWMDPVKRPGPEAMAIDEWLLETAQLPVLRVYGWSGDWGSIGYFGRITEASHAIRNVDWVRRWTGGGTVDHRADWTYTLVVPISDAFAKMRGGDSYFAIHSALAAALAKEGIASSLGDGTHMAGGSLCFENPVGHDLIGENGAKLAGAGQRRTSQGLLHQGSVAIKFSAENSRSLAEGLAAQLAVNWEAVLFEPDPYVISQKTDVRYRRKIWTEKR